MEEIRVTNIQKYSIHDGNGIRTTVFFKGCPLRCQWCHNPETQGYSPQLMFYKERCIGCGNCERFCQRHAVRIVENDAGIRLAETDRHKCIGCGECSDICLANARELCGKSYTVRELFRELKKDTAFYETSGGGVTLSGGEVLSMNMDFIETLAHMLYDNGISVYIDTSGAVPYENIQRILPYTEIFLYDIKSMSESVHKAYTGVSNEHILENLIRLNKEKGRIWLRIPIIAGVNDDLNNIEEIIVFLKNNFIRPEHIHLLPYHTVGIDKYERLEELPREKMLVPKEQTLEALKDIFEKAGFDHVYIGG
ncbi:glycyl-radical enzyme activating protein [Agathobacter sp.]|uniref:glycyl-radical enzyme activating protein n=1 Tax=Agathobacter sp. TaxID=2021311 RepID=UPI003FD8D3A0